MEQINEDPKQKRSFVKNCDHSQLPKVTFYTSSLFSSNLEGLNNHQEFRSVPKMEGFRTNLIFGDFGGGFSLTQAVSIQLI